MSNTQETILYSNIPDSGYFELSITDPSGNVVTSDALFHDALVKQSRILFSQVPVSSSHFPLNLTLAGNDFVTDFIDTNGVYPTAGDIQSAIRDADASLASVLVTGDAGSYLVTFPSSCSIITIDNSADNTTGATITFVDSLQAVVNNVVDGTASNYPYTDVALAGEIASGTTQVLFGFYTPAYGNPSSGGVVQPLFTVAFNSMMDGVDDTSITIIYALGDNDVVAYYANLLILQYVGKPRAYATIKTLVSGIVMDQLPTQVLNGFNLNATSQTLNFAGVAASGAFSLNWMSGAVSIAWNATLDTLQSQCNSLFGVGNVAITGSIAGQQLVLTFNIDTAPALVSVSTNTLETAGSAPVVVSLITNQAVGAQLNILGQYAGVSRSGVGRTGPVTLDDADFIRLIQLATITNTAGSSLATIQQLLRQYFPNEILVFDHANTAPMTMSYLVSTSLGDQGLIELFIADGLLPSPMGVAVSVIGAPVINTFFAVSDYFVSAGAQPANTTPLNNFGGYDLAHNDSSFIWMDYSYSL